MVTDLLPVNTLNTLNTSGNGEVLFTYVQPSPINIAEPGSLVLLGTGLLGLGIAK